MIKIYFILIISIYFSGCSKMQEKKTDEVSKIPSQQNQMPDKTENSSSKDTKSSGEKDEKAEELTKTADDAITKYAADKSEENKSQTLKTSLAAGNYLMFEASLPAKEKYRPALKYYRKVLEIDPENAEALKNKNQIEEIYKQMGMPVPQ